jgi:hypothetical protein
MTKLTEREYVDLCDQVQEALINRATFDDLFAMFPGHTVADIEAAFNDVEQGWDMEPQDMFLSDAEADADVLASAGWGTDEDYGYYGDSFDDY